LTVSGTVEGSIVQHHGYSVSSEPHIQLDGIRSLADSQLKGGKGVLRCGAGRAAMRYHRATGKVKERVHPMGTGGETILAVR
jgi:hypothetical protein